MVNDLSVRQVVWKWDTNRYYKHLDGILVGIHGGEPTHNQDHSAKYRKVSMEFLVEMVSFNGGILPKMNDSGSN